MCRSEIIIVPQSVQLRNQHAKEMTRLKKELTNRGIIYDVDDIKVMLYGSGYDNEQRLVDITSEFVIVVHYSAVLDPFLRLYDRHTLTEIGEQQLYPERSFSGSRTWGSYAYA